MSVCIALPQREMSGKGRRIQVVKKRREETKKRSEEKDKESSSLRRGGHHVSHLLIFAPLLLLVLFFLLPFVWKVLRVLFRHKNNSQGHTEMLVFCSIMTSSSSSYSSVHIQFPCFVVRGYKITRPAARP